MAYTPSDSVAFSQGSYTPAATFVFQADVGIVGELSVVLAGAGAALVAAVVPRADLAVSLVGVSGQFGAIVVANAARMHAALAGAGVALVGKYDANVMRYKVCAAEVVRQNGVPASHDVCMPHNDTLAVPSVCNAVLNPASAQYAPTSIAYDHTLPVRAPAGIHMELAASLHASVRSVQALLDWVTQHGWFNTDDASPISADASSVVQQMTKLRPADWRNPVQDNGTTRHDFIKTIAAEPEEPWRYTPGVDFAVVPNPDYTPTYTFGWPNVVPRIDLAMRHIVGIDGLSFLAPRRQAALDKTKRCIPVEQARRPPPGQSILPEPERPPYEPPTGHVTVTIQTQQVYTMQHVISVKTVPGNIDVPMSDVSLSYDADSFAWQFSGVLADKAALSLVQSASAVELAVNIDGNLWHVLIESIERGIQFAQHSISLRGRSLTAELGAPYVLASSATMGDDLTVQQLADSLMPEGWSIAWDAPTWIVPGGAFSYINQTPIQALASLVADIGCVAIPHRSQRTITVQRRYPVYPWYFGPAQADVSIPEAALLSVSLRPGISTQANGVYVHGGEIGGVLAWCRLTGTDGAKLAPTVSNSLMTDVVGCRLLGERILSGQQSQPAIRSATIPLDGNDFPLVKVGDLVQIAIGGDIVKGIVNSVQIDASLAKVSQTLYIGEETANVWTAFNSLMPRDPLLVGGIASTDGNVSVINLLDGGVVSVRGTGTIGNKVYIRAGRIEGPAPTMAQNEIVV